MYINDIPPTDTDGDDELRRRDGETMADFTSRLRERRLSVGDTERILSSEWRRFYATDAAPTTTGDDAVEVIPSREDWMGRVRAGTHDAVGERPLAASDGEEIEVIGGRDEWMANAARGGR